VLEAVLPSHEGPTATAPVVMGDDGLELVDGVEARPSSSTSLPAPWR
jgi:arginase